MTINYNKKKEGFAGQKAVVIPRQILSKQCVKNPVIESLYITDLGFYPKAQFHYRERVHGADQHILIYCIDGKGELEINEKKYTIQRDSFFVIPMNTGHSYRADEHDPWTIYWIHFKGSRSTAIVDLLVKQKGSNLSLLPFHDERLHVFNEMYSNLEKGYSLNNLLYVNMCLWHYLTSFVFSEKFYGSKKAGNISIVDIAIDLMQNKINETLSLEEIAQRVNLSASHFSNLFKKQTGFSPIEYFIHLKIQKASQYLLFTELRV
ncbi:MAG: AraC family transcriptional regulator, partial [Segetibacter sp.]|nr:AraC family transcriptional regulator [Segetibacter sp.]